MLRSCGRQSERLANNYISYASTVRRIRQQLWFNHRCKDLGLVPAGLKLKSPLNTQEAIQIVKSTCRRLIRPRINQVNNKRHKYHPLTAQYHNYSEYDYRSGCRNVSHCHQQFFSELHSPGRNKRNKRGCN